MLVMPYRLCGDRLSCMPQLLCPMLTSNILAAHTSAQAPSMYLHVCELLPPCVPDTLQGNVFNLLSDKCHSVNVLLNKHAGIQEWPKAGL